MITSIMGASISEMEPPLILRSLQGIEEEETALPHCSASLSCLAVYVVKVMFRSCVLIDYKFSFLEIRTTFYVENVVMRHFSRLRNAAVILKA